MSLSVEAYTELNTSPLPPLHQEVLEFTIQHHPMAHMVSGHVQGQLLRFISTMQRPRRILEIGTFTGFSALCLADGLTADGLLYTLELREEDAATARSYFTRSPRANQIRSLTGNAADLIPSLCESWDLVFIDADKTGYSNYFDLVLPSLAPTGIILADNTLFHGEVLEEPVKGKNAKAIAAFNQKVAADHRVEQVLLSVRDGLTLIRKRQ